MAGEPVSLKGVALISGGGANSTVAGALHFVQDPSTGYTEVRGRVTGLAPGLHGFHIHAFGDTTNGCNSTGPHFNPHNKSHGAPVYDERHLSNLGNIEANEDGIAEVFIKDLQISLSGPDSILGWEVVIHADSDDLGKGVHELSKSIGHAGARIGCGIIGIQPTSGAAKFFKSLFDMCRSTYDLSHKALVLNQETRRRQNEYCRAHGIAIPDDGPELEPIAHVNYEMPPINDSMFYPFVDYGMPPPPPPPQNEDQDEDDDYDDGEGDEDEEDE